MAARPNYFERHRIMTTACIITVAITGSVPRREDNPAVPITIAEQVASTQEAFEAGAALAHVHVRNDDQSTTVDPDKYLRLKDELNKYCSGMIVQFSTGGRSGAGRERGQMLKHRPDMASLATGSVNFPLRIYENTPELILWLAGEMAKHDVKPEIEVFDLAMLYHAVDMSNTGLIAKPLHVQFVLGVKHALPARRDILDFEVAQLKLLAPDASWVAAGIGRAQLQVNKWCLEMGGHCRTGLEDNIRLDRETLAPSNAALVRQVVELCPEYDRHPASVAEARQILGLPKSSKP